jgi:hypothetical protein
MLFIPEAMLYLRLTQNMCNFYKKLFVIMKTVKWGQFNGRLGKILKSAFCGLIFNKKGLFYG